MLKEKFPWSVSLTQLALLKLDKQVLLVVNQ